MKSKYLFLALVFTTTCAAPNYRKCVKKTKANLCMRYHHESTSGCMDMLEFDIVPSTKETCIKHTTNCKAILTTCLNVFLGQTEAQMLLQVDSNGTDAATTTTTLSSNENTLINVRHNLFIIKLPLSKKCRGKEKVVCCSEEIRLSNDLFQKSHKNLKTIRVTF